METKRSPRRLFLTPREDGLYFLGSVFLLK